MARGIPLSRGQASCVDDVTCRHRLTSRVRSGHSLLRQDPADSGCLCRIVASHGWNPSVQAASDDGLLIRTNPADRSTLREMIAELREVAHVVERRDPVVDDSESPRSRSR
ncbi:MAG: hypothetical protein ACOCPX_06735 [Halapricum sp.]